MHDEYLRAYILRSFAKTISVVALFLYVFRSYFEVSFFMTVLSIVMILIFKLERVSICELVESSRV